MGRFPLLKSEADQRWTHHPQGQREHEEQKIQDIIIPRINLFMNLQSPKAPLLTPVLRWFMLAMVMANISGNMAVMLIPLYLDELGANITQIGLVFTLLSVVSLITQVFGGWVSDSIGRLKAIAMGSLPISIFLYQPALLRAQITK